MSDSGNWLENNTRYLANAVAQLRALLEQHAQQAENVALVLPPTPVEHGKPRSGWRLFERKLGSTTVPPGSSVSVTTSSPNVNPNASPNLSPNLSPNPNVNEAPTDLLAGLPPMDPPPALLILGQRLGLSTFELEILLLCAAMELDTSIAPLCARAQGNPGRPYPTFALALALFDQPAWEALSPEGPLRHWRLIEINQPAAAPLTTSALRADERIANYLKGLNYLDDRLAPLVTSVSPPEMRGSEPALPASQQRVVDMILRSVRQPAARQSFPVIQLLGAHAPAKQLIVQRVTDALALQAYRLPLGVLPTQMAEIENLARLWQRESLLLPITLYLDCGEAADEATRGAQVSAVNRLLDRLHGIVFLGTRNVWPGLVKSNLAVDVAQPQPAEQQQAWAAALGAKAGSAPGLLAAQFNLDTASIEAIAANVLVEETPEDDSLPERLWAACRAGNRPQLENLAQCIEPRASWDDVVLPATETGLLRQIADQVGHRTTVYDTWGFRNKTSRGLGINALFAGDSGTGKTMAAEVLASHLKLDLYRIDLSAVVSKYIGETEKNLRRLFDVAEDCGAILFFDEADALFGKRSEVKDSHDRYANIEINYLLQRMEAYRGLAILATNVKSALDPAFLRRLRFIVNFPFPGVAERKSIWQKVFPAGVPTEGLDFDRLARLNLTGGHIHNTGLNAAFLAAQAGTAVTMPLLLAAARTEFRKLDKPINEDDFRWSELRGAVA
jgi:hypothetical protein